ncbi:MAG: hypothetical protein GY920_15945 [Aliivibrio sp.]|nr:hypothetical protein [Aliivibrio sp.]
MVNNIKIEPPKKKNKNNPIQNPTAVPMSQEETKTILMKVTPDIHAQIKSFAAERGMTIKQLILYLFNNERGDL